MKREDFSPKDCHRFLKKLDVRSEQECWIWQGSKLSTGYGQFGLYTKPKRTMLLAHRVSYALHIGEVPDGIFICHKCDTPSCCNPSHLFLGSQKDNLSDASSKGRMSSGDNHYRSKLSEEDVLRIRTLRKEGYILKDIAIIFNVTLYTIWDVCNRTWKHVP